LFFTAKARRSRFVTKDEEIAELWAALDELIKLQRHYALLLNQYDGGRRLQFHSSRDWVARLREIKALSAPG